jgi:hypothetical protein
LGWVDALAETTIGTLTVEISGSEENKNKALAFLKEQAIEWEVLNHDNPYARSTEKKFPRFFGWVENGPFLGVHKR